MTSPADLETIADKLEQAYAILAYSGATTRRLSTVRALLGAFFSDDMPTVATCALWTRIAETMFRLGCGEVTTQDLDNLGLEIHDLRKAILEQLARIAC